MNYCIFVYRSLTFAQKSVRALDRAGIPSSVMRPPAQNAKEGCAYGVKVRAPKCAAAAAALNRAGLATQNVLQSDW